MGRKSKADERKPEILKAAYEVVKREGLEKTTLARIAQHMGVATSLLTHYFKSKEEIIRQLADYMIEKYDETLILDFSRIEDPRERLDVILKARFWEYSRDEIDDKVWFDVYNLSLRNEVVRTCFIDQYKSDQKIVEDELQRILDGFGRSDISSGDLAKALIMMAEGINFYNSFMSEETDIESAVTLMKDMFISYIERSKK